MCTGITHVLRCPQCNAVVLKLREACPGYTCHEAQNNCRRGVCRTGIEYTHYDRPAHEPCLYCELESGGDILRLTAETCDEGGEPWPEDVEEDVDDEEGGAPLGEDNVTTKKACEHEEEDEEEGGAKLR
ncbi:hypothetical protein F5Y19DRAFT_364761 [Xylariaceae sp. FL1651]|nr:hypothetical protein F5Y19DRAFT_364761 [Xylariaceae sp. FL1651]